MIPFRPAAAPPQGAGLFPTAPAAGPPLFYGGHATPAHPRPRLGPHGVAPGSGAARAFSPA